MRKNESKRYSDFFEELGDKYNMNVEDRTMMLLHLSHIKSTVTDSLNLYKILLAQLERFLGSRKFNKFYNSYLNSKDVVDILGENNGVIVFHKFDKEELKNRLIRSVVIKSILSTCEGFDNFLCWCYLKTCITALINEKTKYDATLQGLIELLDELYGLALDDKNSSNDNFGIYYRNISLDSNEQTVFDFTHADKAVIAECALKTLNKTKEYRNTAAECSKVVIQEA